MKSNRNAHLVRSLAVAFCLVLFTATLAQSAGQTNLSGVDSCLPVEVGSTAFSWQYPLNTYYEAVRTQSIYLASEIGQGGNITALALNIVTVPPLTLNNWTIRIKQTKVNSFDTSWSLHNSGWTVVYQNNETVTTTGWRTFTFTTPFTYDGTSNLMIDYSFNNSVSSEWGWCSSYRPAPNRSITRGAYHPVADPLTWYGTIDCLRNNNVPSVVLTICGASNVPGAPSNLTWDSKTADAITWAWTPSSTNETGFEGHDAAGAVVWTTAAGETTYEETGLAPNTQYTRHVHAFNDSGPSDPSNTFSTYTLPVDPNAICNRQAGCPSYALNTSFTFTSVAAFGSGSLDHYHYVWDRNQEYTFDGSEPTIWSGGAMQLIGNQFGYWYLHLTTHNGGHDANGTVHLGPYVVQEPVGYAAGDLDHDCDVDPADLESFMLCGSGPGVDQMLPGCSEALLDNDSDVDSDDFAIFQRCWSGEGFITDLNCGY